MSGASASPFASFRGKPLADSGVKRLARARSCLIVTADSALHDATAREGNATAYYPAIRAFLDA